MLGLPNWLKKFSKPASGSGGGGDTVFVTSGQSSTLRDDFTGKIGFKFTPTANITVTHLGLRARTGNSHSHLVSIYDPLNSLLTSATVNLSGATANTDVFISCASVSLASGTEYYIVADYTSGGGDQWGDADTVLTTTADAAIGGAIFGSGPPFSTGGSAGKSFGNPNFQYTKP